MRAVFPTAHVVGSINRDVVAYAQRLPMPGETVLGTRGALFPGGKGANQAAAIARLGHTPRLHGRVGADNFGSDMRAFLAGVGVECAYVVVVPDAATGFALITVDDRSENCITVVPGANALWPDGLPAMAVAAGDMVVAQLEVPLAIVIQAFEQARAAGAHTVLNPAPIQPLPAALLALTDVLILNETELAGLAGRAPSALDGLEKLAEMLSEILTRGPALVVLTLGASGVLVQAKGASPVRLAAHAVEARDTTGAGDCFVGAFVAASLEGHDVAAAARFANAAAALSVTRDGAAASFPGRAEVDAFLSRAASSQRP
jgi:ribokinase